MTGTLQGKTALITGASGGLGAAIARELSSRGANIVVNYPFPEHEETCRKVGESLKTPWIAVRADLSTTHGPKDLVEATVKEFKQVDILVHNAAHFVIGSTEELTAEQWDAGYAVNVRGAFLLTQAVLPYLTPFTPTSSAPLVGSSGGSRIICISSGTCRGPDRQPGAICYASSKGALETMIKFWAAELPAKYGCTVNGVSPGPIDGEMMRKIPNYGPELMNQLFGNMTPCEGSMAEPSDVARTVAFLAEPTTKWINGEIIMVNGGLIMV